jgi:hypothetical protein
MYAQTEDLGVLQTVFVARAIAFAFKTSGREATEDGFDATKRRLDVHLHG